MKPLILITSCAYHVHRNKQCRETWLKEWGCLVDYRFVLGVGNTSVHGDELIVQTDDSYTGLPAKIQASHKWALEQGYEHILKTDCDIYVHVPRLLTSGFNEASYIGNLYYPEFAMGAAYWLDKRASEVLVNAPLPYPGTPGGDDVWVGKVMADNGIAPYHDDRYYIGPSPNWDTVISIHTTGPPPFKMADIHRRFVG